MSYFYYPEQFGSDHCRQLSQKKIKRASAFNRLEHLSASSNFRHSTQLSEIITDKADLLQI